MREVTIFTGPGCTSCERAKAFLTSRGIRFRERSVAGDQQAIDELMRLDVRMLPVIKVGAHVMTGFDAAKLAALLDEGV